MQNLAPGSEWIDDVTIADAQGTIISIRPEASAVSIRNNDEGLNSESDEAWTADMLAIIDRANLDPVRVTARRLTHELRRNLDAIRFAVPNAHYDNILDNIKKLEALL